MNKNIKLAGTSSLLYSTRKTGSNTVRIAYEKVDMPMACMPAIDTSNVIEDLRKCIPQISQAQNALQIGLMNINLVVHCATAVLNAGWIEYSKGDFEFYWHGMTESVCRVLERVDEEINMVGKVLGLEMKPALQILNKYYPTERAESLHQFVTNSRAHGGSGPSAPKNLRHRYVAEDVPIGLVCTSSIGRFLNVPTPAIDSIICLASLLNEEDYRQNGLTLDQLGFSNMSKQEIINYVNIGK